MTKVIFKGELDVCHVKVDGTDYLYWAKDEVRDLSPVQAKKLVEDNKDFVYAEGEKVEVKKTVEMKSKDITKFDMDLNDDGVIDNKDKSLAAKVLATKHKN